MLLSNIFASLGVYLLYNKTGSSKESDKSIDEEKSAENTGSGQQINLSNNKQVEEQSNEQNSQSDTRQNPQQQPINRMEEATKKANKNKQLIDNIKTKSKKEFTKRPIETSKRVTNGSSLWKELKIFSIFGTT